MVKSEEFFACFDLLMPPYKSKLRLLIRSLCSQPRLLLKLNQNSLNETFSHSLWRLCSMPRTVAWQFLSQNLNFHAPKISLIVVFFSICLNFGGHKALFTKIGALLASLGI